MGCQPCQGGKHYCGFATTTNRLALPGHCPRPLHLVTVLDGSGSWGLGVVEADDEEEVRAFAAGDPVVTTGTGTMEVGKMLGGFVRPRPAVS